MFSDANAVVPISMLEPNLSCPTPDNANGIVSRGVLIQSRSRHRGHDSTLAHYYTRGVSTISCSLVRISQHRAAE